MREAARQALLGSVTRAGVAQLAERLLPKQKVASSSLVSRSTSVFSFIWVNDGAIWRRSGPTCGDERRSGAVDNGEPNLRPGADRGAFSLARDTTQRSRSMSFPRAWESTRPPGSVIPPADIVSFRFADPCRPAEEDRGQRA